MKLLVVDDSALVRRLMAEAFAPEPDIELAFARNGLEALELLSAFQPDVITLDIYMPLMDGLTCLDRIMVERPTPVVVVSSLTAEGAEETLEALALGAVDVIEKPGGALSLQMDMLAPRLVETIRAAAKARVRQTHRLTERIRARAAARAASLTSRPQPQNPRGDGEAPQGLVVIGASTGGPPALDKVLARLPADFRWPVLVAQHMPAAFTGPLARRLDDLCELKVVEVAGPVRLTRGSVYVGKGEADLLVSARTAGPVALAAPASPNHRWHPSVDRLVESAMAHVPASRIVGVLLSGMGNDGAAAMTRLRQSGGRTIAEAEETAVVWGMPGELVRAGGAEIVSGLESVADHLLDLVGPS